MDKPTFRLVGSPCGQHGQYSFYKALRYTAPNIGSERILALGDFFFVKLWQDSDLLSIGELQLLWTDRVSDETLVSLRLYFLPENTPDGRGAHGQDEVLAISDKVVVRVPELVTRVRAGAEWQCGLRAVWRGECEPRDAGDAEPLHASRLDFGDVDKEKAALEDPEAPGVVVFSYPRYCRYRALLRRLEGLQCAWLRDGLVAALGGYAAPTRQTRILFCRDTFEYPELEGHEMVCNHLAPRLKGRPRGRRRRRARSHSEQRSASDSSGESDRDQHKPESPPPPPRATLRNGADAEDERRADAEKERLADAEKERLADDSEESSADRAFVSQLRDFHRQRESRIKTLCNLKHFRLRSLYECVAARGGYERVCREDGWAALHAALVGRPASRRRSELTKRHYEKVLLPFEKYEKRNGSKWWKAQKMQNGKPPPKPDRSKAKDMIPIATIDITKESPTREVEEAEEKPVPRLRTPSPEREVINLNSSESFTDDNKPASELNQEFLDSLPAPEAQEPPKITVKPVEKLIEKPEPLPKAPGLTEYLHKQSLTNLSSSLLEMASKQAAETASEQQKQTQADGRTLTDGRTQADGRTLTDGRTLADGRSLADGGFLRELATKQNLGEVNTTFLAEIARAQQDLLSSSSLSDLGGKLASYALNAAGLANGLPNGTSITVQPSDKVGQGSSGTVSPVSRPAGRSSLRSVRVKQGRAAAGMPPTSLSSTPLRPDSASRSPPTPAAPPATAERSDRVTSTSSQHQSDDEIIEVPYKPKTPEIIDLDEYESPESPQAVKKKKLDILKERGLEVTTVPSDWPAPGPPVMPAPTLAAMVHPNAMLGLNPAVQQQIMTQAQFFQMYNTFIPSAQANGLNPPKVIQGKSIYGSSGPEKIVYGNPKDPFMPPPHVIQGAPPLKQPRLQTPPTLVPDILDLSSKQGVSAHKPAVEIVRIPTVPSPSRPATTPHNLSSKTYPVIDGKAIVGSNLEITLVGPRTQTTPPKPPRPRQKRSSTGQFMSNKSAPTTRESPGYKSSPSPTVSTSRTPDYKPKSTNIVIPNYQMSSSGRESDVSPTSSTSSRDGGMAAFTSSLFQSAGGSLLQNQAQLMEMQAKGNAQNLASFIDPSMYMSAVYNGLAGQLSGQITGLSEQLSGQLQGLTEQQLAVYHNLMSTRLMRNYPGLLNMSSVSSTPTSKN